MFEIFSQCAAVAKNKSDYFRAETTLVFAGKKSILQEKLKYESWLKTFVKLLANQTSDLYYFLQDTICFPAKMEAI